MMDKTYMKLMKMPFKNKMENQYKQHQINADYICQMDNILSEELSEKTIEYKSIISPQINQPKRKSRYKKAADLTEEQRRKQKEYKKRYKAKLTEAARIRIRASDKKRRDNFNEEQRKIRRETTRKWFTNLSEEKRKEKAEKDRILRANLTNEQRYKQYESICKNKQRNREFVDKWREILTKEQLLKWQKWLSGLNPLKILIRQVIDKNLNMNLLTELDKNLFEEILQMLTFQYPKNILTQNKSSIQKLSHEIDVNCLMELIKRWEGWTNYDGVKSLTSLIAYEDIYYYLYNDFQHNKKLKGNSLFKEIDNYFNLEHCISVTGALKHLHALFNHSPHNRLKYYKENDNMYRCTLEMDSFSCFIFHSDFVT